VEGKIPVGMADRRGVPGGIIPAEDWFVAGKVFTASPILRDRFLLTRSNRSFFIPSIANACLLKTENMLY
jgi:hypothetical protein